MSDWGAARSLAAATAELDLVMPGPTTPFGPALVDAVTEGRVPAATVTEKVRRIVELGEKVGAAGPDATPGVPYGTFAPPPVDLAAITAQLRETAAAGFVLLRNEQDVLPLAAGTRVALIGEHAVHPRILGGGSAFVFPTGVSTPAAALRDALGDAVEIVAGVAVSERIGAPELSALGVPGTDRSGVAVRFLGEGDQLLGSDERASSTYNWNNAFAAGVDPQDVRTVEVHTTYTAATSGPHVFGCSGVGRHAVRLDGQTVVDTELALPPGADGVEGLTRPPQAGHSVHLVAGQQLDWVVRRTVAPEPGRLTIVALQINVTPAGPSDDEALLAAEAAARAADVAVVVVGTTEEAEGEGFDRALTTEGLSLPGRQDELVRRVAAVNPRTVVVVDAGAPVLLPWRDDVAAVLATWFPGQEFGAALADVLTGAVEPGGRLPVTWLDTAADPLPSTHSEDGVMQYTEGLHVGHRRYLREGAEPAYWFGHGLGYTTWAHEDPLVTADAVTVGLRNTGSRPGRDVVQVYLARPDSALDRPVRWLAGFGGATVGAGERTDVRVELPWRAFAHWDEQAGDWAVEPGEFTVLVGGDAGSARVIGSITPGSGPVPTS
jgi:beta-glucosidase